MLKVMIVDDEPKVREGLKTIIKWEEYGYEICCECADGIEGLNMVGSLKPDLVMVDIRMPEMNGLEFIEKAKQEGCQSKFIILTGYADFSYTKKAIQLSVYSYLLKPVEEVELIQNILEIKNVLSKEKEVSSYINDGKIYSRDAAIKAALKGDGGFLKQECFLETSLLTSSKTFQVALADMRDIVTNYNPDSLIKGIYSQLFGNSKNLNFVFEIDGQVCIVLVDSETPRNKRILEKLSAYLSRITCREILITLGSKVEGIGDISKSYGNAVALIDKKFYFSSAGLLEWEELKYDIMFSDPCSDAKSLEIDIPKCIEKLFVVAEVMNRSRMQEIIIDLFAVLRAKKYSEMKLKGFIVNLLNAVYEKTVEKHPLLSEVLPLGEDRVAGVYDKTNLNQLMEYFMLQMEKLIEIISTVDSQKVIKKIILYIESNYHRDLTLEMLGGLFGYNSCYLGKVIRQFTGEHFNTYLEKVRIEQAKILLQQGFKVSDVAYRTGFKNIDYFYLKFKKNVGLSTSEYKKKKMSNF